MEDEGKHGLQPELALYVDGPLYQAVRMWSTIMEYLQA